MVNVVQTDVPTEPLQHLWQLVVGAAGKGGLLEFPIVVLGPIHVFVLVLNIEQPDTPDARHSHDGNLDEQVGLDPDGKVRQQYNSGQSQVAVDHTQALTLARFGVPQSVAKEEQKQRSQDEQDRGVAIEAVSEPGPLRGSKIFRNRHSPYIAMTTPVQIASGAVVHGVFVPPIVIRRKGEYASNESDQSVCPPAGQKRTMSAIVEEDEDPVKETGRQHD